jgi:DNA-directed RNA polymerase II subunit RPB1
MDQPLSINQQPKQAISVMGGGIRGPVGLRNRNIKTIPVRAGQTPQLSNPIPRCTAVSRTDDASIRVTRREKERLLAQAQRREEALPTLVIQANLISIFSTEDLIQRAVCEVTEPEQTGLGSVNDPRMGVIEDNVVCSTCHKDNFECPGHLGFIRFNDIFYHPLFMRTIVQVLTCVCNSCGGLLLTKEQLQDRGMLKYSGAKRLRLLEPECANLHCMRSRSEFAKPCRRNPTFSPGRIKDLKEIVYQYESRSGKKEATMNIRDVQKILNAISDEDAQLMGFANGSHPRNMILEVWPVIPPVARPPVIQDGIPMPDHLTIMYTDIVRYNRTLGDLSHNPQHEERRAAARRNMFFAIEHMIDNTDGKYSQGHHKVFQSIKQRVQGKKAIIRGATMGKRVDYSWRTVLSPDPSLRFGEIRVPLAVARVVTVPIMVNQINIEQVRRLMAEGKITHITPGAGDLKGRRVQVNDRIREEVRINIGDKVDRWMQDGDKVVFNRQPTLHKHSIMGYDVKIGTPLTWGLHLSYTTPHNADFDGDEATGHGPQSLQTIAEVAELMHVQNCLMDSRTNKPAFGIVYDAVTAAYLMTAQGTMIDEDDYSDCIMLLTEIEQLPSLPRRLEKHGVLPRSGQALFSALLPEDFYYRKGNVLIVDGVLIQGRITKDHIGTSHNSIIQVLYKNYGPARTVGFLTDTPFVMNRWLTSRGFSVGLQDCLPNTGVEHTIESEVAKAKLYAEAMGTPLEDPLEEERREGQIITKINNVRDVGLRIAKENLSVDNSISVMSSDTGGGAKGAPFNVGQIVAALGQQFVKGQRPPKSIGGNRSLPYYDADDNDLEARGFVAESFMRGLTPAGLFFHQWGGREGLIDTAIKTADTGAMHHRIAKALEDIKVAYDGSVRNAIGTLFQYIYGGDGFDSSHLQKVKTKEGEMATFIDLKATTEAINIKHGWYPTEQGWKTMQEIQEQGLQIK